VCEREQQIEGGQIKDIGRGSRDETQRGVYMGVYDADKHDRENTHPGGEEQVAYLVFCSMFLQFQI